MSRSYQWSLVTQSNTVIITEPRKYRLLAKVEAWRRKKDDPDATISVEEARRRGRGQPTAKTPPIPYCGSTTSTSSAGSTVDSTIGGAGSSLLS